MRRRRKELKYTQEHEGIHKLIQGINPPIAISSFMTAGYAGSMALFHYFPYTFVFPHY
ncbi:MAG: hypothetical protein ACMUJM_12760 [bacterium]